MTDTDIPAYPMSRAPGCPFDPPPEARSKQERDRLTRVRLWDGSTPWLVTRHADQRALLADPRVSVDVTRPGYPSPAPVTAPPSTGSEGSGRPGGSPISFVLMDDPEHARLRRMVTAPFTVRRSEAMRPTVQRIVDDLIDDMLAGPRPVDLVEAFALPVPSLVICELLGVPYEDHVFFQDNSKTLIRRDADVGERDAARAALLRYLEGLIAAKTEDPGDDVLSGLVERVAAGELTRREAAQMGVLLLFAGHETTANMISLGTAALLEHPEQLARLRDGGDPALVASAVEELLRYLHIIHTGARRVALEDIEIAGRTIRAGTGLILATDIGNRDADAFPDPDTLDVRRNPRRHMAFGFGVHQCLGQSLARVELQVVYGTLYRRVPTLRLATGVDELPFKHDGHIYGLHELPVTW